MRKIQDTGFSLLELVVAVSLMLILAVVGFVAYQNFTDNARQAAVEQAASDVFTAALAVRVTPSTNIDMHGEHTPIHRASLVTQSTPPSTDAHYATLQDEYNESSGDDIVVNIADIDHELTVTARGWDGNYVAVRSTDTTLDGIVLNPDDQETEAAPEYDHGNLLTCRDDSDVEGTPGLQYNVVDGAAHVSNYTGEATHVVIPCAVDIDGTLYTVTSVANYGLYNDALHSVVLPDTMTYIGKFAMEGNNFTELILPEGLIELDDGAVEHNQITELTIPSTVQRIGISAFINNDITSIVIPETTTDLGKGAFQGNNIRHVELPNTLTTLSQQVFLDNEIAEITIPESVTYIGKYALEGNNLSEIQFPSSLQEIDDGAFEHNQLETVVIPDSVQRIGVTAFLNNDMTSVTFGTGLQALDNEAFSRNNIDSVFFDGTPPNAVGNRPFWYSDPTIYYHEQYADRFGETWAGHTTAAR